ncbi:hypothetical protein [Runella sp.]|uniref:hypothetical protein n=1 Tax=Runella sp. TaxID=1960881 RepID=UPI003D0C3366
MSSALLKKYTFVFIGLFFCFEVVITIRNFSVQLGDLQVYFNLSKRIIVDHLLPYRDFPSEYPPLAVIPTLIPQLLCQIGTTGFQGFVVFFVLQNILLGLYMGRVVLKTAQAFLEEVRALEISRIYWMLWGISLPIFLFRYDGFVALLTILTVYFIVKQSPGVSGSWLAAGIFAKLYPIVLLPPIIVYYFINKQYRFLLLFLGGFSALSAVIFTVMYLLAGNDVVIFLKYHRLRGIQIESFVGGGLLLWYKIIDAPLETISNYGAIHLVTSWTDSLLKVLSWGFPICYLALSGVIYRYFSKQIGVSVEMLLIAFAAALLLFLVCNKVLSPQYLIWLLPIIPFLRSQILYCFAAAFMITIFIYPGSYHRLVEMKFLWVLLLNVRNGLIFVMLLLTLFSMPFSTKNSTLI